MDFAYKMVNRQNNYEAYFTKNIQKPRRPAMPIWNSNDAIKYAQQLKEYEINLELYKKAKQQMNSECHQKFRKDLEDTYGIKHWPKLLRLYIYQRAWREFTDICCLAVVEQNYREIIEISKKTLQYFDVQTH